MTKAQPSRRAPRVPPSERRAQVLTSARAVFLQHGFAGTSVRDVARAAGVNEAIIYRHFTGKEQLWADAVETPGRRLVHELLDQAAVVTEAALQGDSEAITSGEKELWGLMCEACPVIGALLFADPSMGRAFYETSWRPHVAIRVRELADRMAPQGSGEAPTDVVGIAYAAVLGMNHGAAMQALFSSSQPRGKRAQEITRLLSSGLLDANAPHPSFDDVVALPPTRPPGYLFSHTEHSEGDEREAILDAAREVFTRNGFAAAKTREIATAAGVSEPHIAREIGSKSELFAAVLVRPLETLMAQLTALVPAFSFTDVAHRVEVGPLVHRDMYRTMEEFASPVLVALFADTDKGKKFYVDNIHPRFFEIADTLEDLMSVEARSVIGAFSLLQVMVGMHLAVHLPAMFSHESVDPALIGHAFTAIISFGIPGLGSTLRAGR